MYAGIKRFEIKIAEIKRQYSAYKVLFAQYEEDGYKKMGLFKGNIFCNIGDVFIVEVLERVNRETNDLFFEIKSFKKAEYLTEQSIIQYLQNFKNVGTKKATKIVDCFGVNTLSIISDSYERLVDAGLSVSDAVNIYEEITKQTTLNRMVVFFEKYGLPLNSIEKIFAKYKEDSIEIIKNNPYVLVYPLDVVGFDKADYIATHEFNIKPDDDCRLQMLIYNAMKQAEGQGHVFVDFKTLEKKIGNVTKNTSIVTAAMMFANKKAITFDESLVYLSKLYYSEIYVAKKLRRLIDTPASYKLNASPEEILSRISTDIDYADEQKTAILKALSSKVMILTGGPGTGKSTCINGILKAFLANDKNSKICFAAPTGKAAKRMEEVTKQPASTIHRLLEYKPSEEGKTFLKNENNPIDADIIIIDEASMIDLEVFSDFLSAMNPATKLIVVGDVNQLPSVGPGNVLDDMIKSKVITVVKLIKIFRQAAENPIVSNAYKINMGEMPVLNDEKKLFSFREIKAEADISLERDKLIDEKTAEKIVNDFVSCWKNPKYGREVQLLTPMKNQSACGSRNLNHKIQEKVNPCINGNEISYTARHKSGEFTYHYRQGDKVIQMKNNYKKGVFNGDTGVIVGIEKDAFHSEDKVFVIFDNNPEETIEFVGRDEIMELDLAYALTIHKSQGSEYKYVLIPVINEHKNMLNKNLLYTGVTRAKEAICLYGQLDAIEYGVSNTSIGIRNSKLALRII